MTSTERTLVLLKPDAVERHAKAHLPKALVLATAAAEVTRRQNSEAAAAIAEEQAMVVGSLAQGLDSLAAGQRAWHQGDQAFLAQ